jgi:hypothetical protein
MVETVDSVRAARRGGYSAPPPQLKFLSAANRAAQQPEAVVAWRG